MPMRESDRLRAPSRGTAAEALAHIDRPDESDRLFVAALEAACLALGLDFAPVMAHVHLESAGLTSPRYLRDKNPSGLGIPSDGTPQPFAIPDYATAARMHASAMNRLVDGTRPEPWTLPAEIEAWLGSVWRWHCEAARAAGVIVRTVGDLNIRYPDPVRGPNATWAWDAQQGAGIVERGRLLFPSLPDQGATPVPAPVPAPTIYDLRNDAHAARFGLSPAERDYLLSRRFPDRNGADPRAIVLHSQDGNTVGSLDWWVNGVVNGQRVQASSTVTIQRDGSVLRVIPEEHGPWTNGDVNRPTAESAKLRALGGNPNVWCLTIELEGDGRAPLTPAQFAATVWQIGDWRSRYPIPLDMVIGHFSINSVSRPNCPDPPPHTTVYGPVKAAIAGSPLPPPPPPTPASPFPDGMDLDLARRWFGQVSQFGEYGFTPGQPLSDWWIANGKATGKWPNLGPTPAQPVERYDTRTYFRFADGTIWWRPNDQADIRLLK